MMSLQKFTSALFVLLLLTGCFGGKNVKENVEANVESTQIEIPSKAAEDFKRAITFLNQGKVGEAKTQFEAMVNEFPQLSGPYANLGLMAAQEKEWEQAEDWMQKAVDRNPKNAKNLNQLGWIQRQSGKFNEAEKNYLAAIKANAKFEDAYLNLGILYDVYMGQFQKAVSYYQTYQAMQNEPNRQVAGWIVDINRRLGTKANSQIAVEGGQ